MPIRKSTDQVYALIRDHIEKGDEGWQPEDPLPTYDELVVKMPASRATIARAMKRLRKDGYITTLPGGGTWVAERTTDG